MSIQQKVKTFFKYGLTPPSRTVNFTLVYLSKYLKLTKVLGRPITAMIEPTNYCNLQCPLCPTGAGLIKRKKEVMTFKDFKMILDRLGSSVIHLRLWNWGEPLLNNDLPKMVKYAKSKRMFVNTSTNSHYLSEENIKKLIDAGLDQLIVSLDGASEKTYNTYRKNGNFKRVVESLKKAAELKELHKTNYPEIKLQFIVMKHNEHEIEKIIQLAKDVRADTLFLKTVGIMDPALSDIEKYLPKNKAFRRYNEQDVSGFVPLSGRVCNLLWEEITVNADGSVVSCCMDAHGRHSFGNLKKQPLTGIWNSEKLVNFRKAVLTKKGEIDICAGCSGSNKDLSIIEIPLR